jgi:hypothetical protein
MSLESKEPSKKPKSNLKHLRSIGIVLSLLGLALFVYFVYSVGVSEILEGIGKIGFGGFAFILFLYLLRICVRASAWKLSVYEPYHLDFKDTFQGVIIGEAVSSLIPLGILASGTAKAVAVSNRIPLVAGLSSVATENLFYTFVTSLFIISGAIAFVFNYQETGWIWTIYLLIAGIFAFLIFVFLMLLRQWHLASRVCEWIYDKGFLQGILENGRLHVRLFENLIFSFYRRYPNRFLPITLFQVLYHAIGIAEVFFVLSKISDVLPNFYSAFLLESVSRVVTITFKLIPFAIGVDEATSQFISENLELGVAVGVTIAILRKGRTLFWAVVGILLIFLRGLTFAEILRHNEEVSDSKNVVSKSQID